MVAKIAITVSGYLFVELLEHPLPPKSTGLLSNSVKAKSFEINNAQKKIQH